MEAKDIKGLTPKQIQDKFSLPSTPKYVTDVTIPEGTTMRTGTVNPVEGWGKGGGMGIRMEITYNNNCLCIGNIRKEFAYEIKKVQIFDNKILVLLSIPQEDTETIDNIYAVSDKGNIIWRSESLKQLYPDQINLPYEYMTVNGSEIEATDFYGRRYFINIKDGRIIKRDVVK